MKRRDVLLASGIGALLATALVVLYVVGPRWLATPEVATTVTPESAPAARKIRARLFYVSDDGLHLTAVEQEVSYGEGTAEQARQIVEAQLAEPKAPLVSAIPPGTKLRTIFLTTKGDAYVDFTTDLQTHHPGGTTNEILTAYSLVNALTLNLPAITGVQILIEGKEVDTLAGHLDLRRPLEHDERWTTQ